MKLKVLAVLNGILLTLALWTILAALVTTFDLLTLSAIATVLGLVVAAFFGGYVAGLLVQEQAPTLGALSGGIASLVLLLTAVALHASSPVTAITAVWLLPVATLASALGGYSGQHYYDYRLGPA